MARATVVRAERMHRIAMAPVRRWPSKHLLPLKNLPMREGARKVRSDRIRSEFRTVLVPKNPDGIIDTARGVDNREAEAMRPSCVSLRPHSLRIGSMTTAAVGEVEIAFRNVPGLPSRERRDPPAMRLFPR
jgi:hypothetical protein